MKDIYITMANQNILNFYGTKLDLKVDYSELYDFELCKVTNDYDISLLDLSTPISHTGLTFNSQCITGNTLNDLKPLVFLIGTGQTGNTCETIVRRRTEKGWTLDFVLNRDSNPWSGGTTFYYWGISGETNQSYYADNNLSFSFTNDGRVKWESYRYSGICNTVSGYTESFYTSTGQTQPLCLNGVSSDFNVTITFDRYKHYENCDIENEGGHNDLITGWTVTNPIESLSGDTESFTIVETLNKKWSDEKEKRLGILKIYLNGRPIYKIKDWEEIIPSVRSGSNPIIQVWGNDLTTYKIKRVKYFEEPLDFVHIHHHYLVSTKPFYSINECQQECDQQILGFYNNPLLYENGDILLTEDNDIVLY